MLISVIDTCTSVLGCARTSQVHTCKHDKSLQSVNNILFSFNKPVEIPPQRTEMEQNREQLLQKFSTAEKNRKGFRRFLDILLLFIIIIIIGKCTCTGF